MATKYGLLINRECRNMGDDIQSYAESLFLPRIDYLVDREYISEFSPKRKDEVVATIMGAWWMHHKWNFPPPKNIIPLWISMHLTNFTPENEGPPLFDELFKGVGGEHLRAYGPVGVRDMATLENLENLDIPTYFSGCVTLTLPKQKKKQLKKKYILLVDLDPSVEDKIKREHEGGDIEIKTASNRRHARRTSEQMDDWEFRKKETIELLELYQNAHCVVTTRLHVSLPCLAMNVPVLCVYDPTESRFSPYNEWLHMVSPSDFLKDNFEYDILSPKPNKNNHLDTREKLTESMISFIDTMSANNKPLSELVKTTYSKEEVYRWRYNLMETALNNWLPSSLSMSRKIAKTKTDQKVLKAKYKSLRSHYTNLLGQHNAIQEQLYYKVRRRVGRTLRRIGVKR